MRHDEVTMVQGGAGGEDAGRGAWGPGEVILGTYEVKAVFEAGGFGQVYRVRHRGWGVDLAMKSLRTEYVKSGGMREAFAAECQGWVNLGLHPHVVSCYYVRDIEGLPCIFAEFMEGGSLDDWISEDRIGNLESILDLALQCLDGLAFAHEMGLVHRDIKPANCLLRQPRTLKITDFGIASGLLRLGAIREVADGRKSAVATLALGGGVVGTPAYMPPEQWDSSLGACGPWTDIYAFGVMLFELCCGERPFDEGGEDATVMKMRHLTVEAPSPGELNSSIPGELSRFILRCLAKKPGQRFTRCSEAREELVKVYGLVSGRPCLRNAPGAVQFRADSLNNRAVSSLDLGDEESARALWEEALNVDYLHPRSTCNLGFLRWRRGEIDDVQMLAMLDNIARELPHAWEADYFTGLVHLERDDCEGARDALQRALQKQGDNPDATMALGEAQAGFSDSSRLLRTIEFSFYGTARELSLCSDARTVFARCTDRSVKTLDLLSGEWTGSVASDWELVSAVISADEKSVLLIRSDGMCVIADLKSGGKKYEIGRFYRHPKGLLAADLSPGEKWAATGGNDNGVILWDLESGAMAKRFEGHGSPVHAVRFSADGRYLMSAEKEGYFRVWDVEGGSCVRASGNGTPSERAGFSDGEKLLSFFGKGVAELWDVPGGRLIREMRFPDPDDAYPVSFSHCGRWILSASKKDRALKLWNASGRCVRTFSGHTDYIYSAVMGSDAGIALSSQFSNLKQWRIVPGNFRERVEYSLSSIKTSEESADAQQRFNRLIEEALQACGKEDWSQALGAMAKLRMLPGYERASEVASLRLTLYAHLEKKGLRGIWPVKSFDGRESRMRTVLSRDGSLMVTALLNREDDACAVELYDCSTGQLLKEFRGDWKFLSVLEISCDNRKIAVGDGEGSLFILDIDSGACLRASGRRGGQVHCIAISDDCRIMASGSKDSSVRVWEPASGRCLKVLEGHGNTVTLLFISRDCRHIVSASSDKTVRVWDISTGSCVVIEAAAYMEGIFLKTAGDMLITAGLGRERTLEAWDPRTGGHLRSFGEFEGQCTAFSVSADERWACVACFAYVESKESLLIHLWDLEEGACVRTVKREGSLNTSIRSIHWSSRGEKLLTAGLNTFLTEWMLDWELNAPGSGSTAPGQRQCP